LERAGITTNPMKEKTTMNICIVSGRIVRNGVVRGSDTKAVSFTVETKYGFNEEEKRERVAYVPCVLFNPEPEMEALLTNEGEGLFVELEGRIHGANSDGNGPRKFNTEVYVKNRTLVVLKTAD
jgi:hypothetical protein